jgi:hypothetical protein
METSAAQQFVDQQLEFNKDVLKSSNALLDGLKRQARLNSALAEQLRDQDNRLKTHHQLIIALTIGNIGCAIGIILVALS